MNRSILCNYDVEAESNFLLESLAACKNLETKTDLEMYFTVNLQACTLQAFVNYFENVIEDLGYSILKNWTTQEQILLILVEVFQFDPKLLSTPKTLKDFVAQYINKRGVLERKGQKEIEKAKKSSKFGSFLKSFLVDVLLFTAGLITMIVTIVMIYMVCRQSKLKALVANITLQHTKAVEAADLTTRYCICEPNCIL